jgi:acetyl esterase/lipase
VHHRRALTALLLAAAVAVGVAACSPGFSSDSQKSWKQNLAYVPGGSAGQRLDLYLPRTTRAGAAAAPLVMFIHGGRWAEGDKDDLSLDDNLKLPELKELLLSHGYAVASLNYRLSDEARYPAQIHDVKAATRYLRANAGSLGVDPEHFIALGESSGGHLAQLLGTTNGDKELEGDLGSTTATSSVQATVSFYGISDLRTRPAQRRLPGCPAENPPITSEGRLLGAEPNTAAGASLAAQASPIAHVDSADPPMLLFHGRQDCNVRPVQSQTMYEALQRVGVRSELTMIDAEHSQPIFYTSEALQKQLLAFLARA